MKYKVLVPKPKAKRMEEHVKLLVYLKSGWEGDQLVQSEIETQETKLDSLGEHYFEVPDQYAWIYSNKIVDGWSFDVKVEFSNSTGSRKDIVRLVPEEI